MHLIKAISFDFFNTLASVKVSPSFQYYQFAKEFGILISQDKLTYSYRSVWLQLKQDKPNYGKSLGLSCQDWWHEFASILFKSNNVHVTDEVLSKCTKHIYNEFTKPYLWQVENNVEETLQKLKENGLRLAIISNYDSRLPELLDSLKLSNYFDAVITSYDTGFAKPHKRIFEVASDKLELPLANILHIGDDYAEDYVGAHNAGMRSIQFVSEHLTEHLQNINRLKPLNPDEIINNFRCLIKLTTLKS